MTEAQMQLADDADTRTDEQLDAELEAAVAGNAAALNSARHLAAVPSHRAEDDDARPLIRVSNDLYTDAREIRRVIATDGRGVPSVFVTGGELTRLGRNDDGHLVIRRHTSATFCHWVAEHSQWQKPSRRGALVPCNPPSAAVAAVREAADSLDEASRLERVVQVPFYTRERSLAVTEGYHGSSRAWYQPSAQFTVPAVSEVPSPSEREAARHLLLTELLGDFPFASQGDRAGAMALLLEPFVRDVIQGSTPLHLVEAATQGTGKTKLAACCLAISLGYTPVDVPKKSLSVEEAEIRKSITTDLMSGVPVIFFDNVKHKLKSPALAQVLTGGTWSDRKLGGNENAELRIRCSWVMTSNNASYDRDTARRISLCRLDLSVLDVPSSVKENPETRDPATLRHPNLEGWVMDHQGRLVWAVLTLVNAWLADGGRAWTGRPLGSFESWSMVIGGILESAGIDGFLSNRDQIQASGADDRDAIVEFLTHWWEKHGGDPVSPQELVTLSTMHDNPLALVPDKGGRLNGSMGYWLKNHRDQVVGGFRFHKCESNDRKWQIRRV